MGANEEIEKVVVGSGLWAGERRQTHSYLLSPDLYAIDQEQKGQLEALGAALQDCLVGMGEIAAVAQDPKLGNTRTWQMISRVLNTGVPSLYRNIQVFQPAATPVLCKVDLMQSVGGRYYIAEIDGHNKHGLGYMALHALVVEILQPEAQTFPGVVTAIVEELGGERVMEG